MKTLTAFEALGPAYRRTLVVLARPFGLGTFLKISLVAALAEIGCMSLAVSLPIQIVQAVAQFSLISGRQAMPRGTSLGVMAGLLIFLSIFAFLYLILAYVFIRLRFVVFDFVIIPSQHVADAWRRYDRPSLRYFWVNLLLMLGFGTIVLATIGPLLLHVARVAAALHNHPKGLIPLFVALAGGILFFSIVIQLLDSLVRDFVLPPMALEDASIESAFARLFRLLREDLGEVILFVLMKVAFTIALTIALMLIVILAMLVLAAFLFGVGLALYALLWRLGLAGQMLVVIYGALAGIFFIATYLASILSMNGVSGVFRTAYGLYFFAGRYPELGNRLEPSAELRAEPQQVAPTYLPLTPLSEPPVW